MSSSKFASVYQAVTERLVDASDDGEIDSKRMIVKRIARRLKKNLRPRLLIKKIRRAEIRPDCSLEPVPLCTLSPFEDRGYYEEAIEYIKKTTDLPDWMALTVSDQGAYVEFDRKVAVSHRLTLK